MSISRTRYSNSYGYNVNPNIPWTYAESGGDISSFTASVNSNIHNEDGKTYRVHVFQTPGAHEITFSRRGIADIFVIAGGGGGGAGYNNTAGGGGGAGGVLQRYGIVVESGTTQIYVGSGGTPLANNMSIWNGQNSSFGSYVAIGGGGGASRYYDAAGSGASGGGGTSTPGAYIFEQGNPGGFTFDASANAGGGGAGKAGGSPSNSITSFPGNGGDGIQVAFNSNDLVYYAGGGAGGVRGTYTSPLATGGLGGGGGLGGSPGSTWTGANATYYGSGGGGGASMSSSNNYAYQGGSGYRGIVMVRYIVDGS